MDECNENVSQNWFKGKVCRKPFNFGVKTVVPVDVPLNHFWIFWGTFPFPSSMHLLHPHLIPLPYLWGHRRPPVDGAPVLWNIIMTWTDPHRGMPSNVVLGRETGGPVLGMTAA